MLYVTFDLERESSNEFENWKLSQRPTLLFALATHIYPCHLILFVCSFLWAWAWAWTCGSSSGLVQLIWVQTSDCEFFFFFFWFELHFKIHNSIICKNIVKKFMIIKSLFKKLMILLKR